MGGEGAANVRWMGSVWWIVHRAGYGARGELSRADIDDHAQLEVEQRQSHSRQIKPACANIAAFFRNFEIPALSVLQLKYRRFQYLLDF